MIQFALQTKILNKKVKVKLNILEQWNCEADQASDRWSASREPNAGSELQLRALWVKKPN